MPMNIFNVVADSATNFFSENIEAMYIVYAICHMFGMSSVRKQLFLRFSQSAYEFIT